MIGKAIYSILTSNPDFTAIVGNRVYPLVIAQGEPMPAVTYQKISNTPTQCKEGVSGLDRFRVQINIYAEKYPDQEALGGIIRDALDNFSGTVSGSQIANITYETETDLHDDAADIFFLEQDYTITINR